MRGKRYRDSSSGSPSWYPRYERDSGIRENGCVSPLYRSSTKLDRSRPVPAREVLTSGGDVRSFYEWEPTNPESREYRQNPRFSGSNRIDDAVRPRGSLFGTIGSIPNGVECAGEGRKMPMPGFGESALGIRGKSTSRKFEWDTLFAGDKIPANVGSNRISYGGLGDSGVPVSMPMDNNGRGLSTGRYGQGMEAYESGRNHEVIDERYATLRGRSSILDSIVDKIEGRKNADMDIDNDNAYRLNLMNAKRRMLLENDTRFAEYEKDIDCRGLDANPSVNQYLMEGFNVQRSHRSSAYGNVERIPVSCEQYNSSGNDWQQVIPVEEDLQLRLQQDRLDNDKLLELRLERNRINDKIILLSSGVNASSDSTSGGHRDWTMEEQLDVFNDSGEAIYQGTSTGSAFDTMPIDGNSFSSPVELSMPRHSSMSHNPSKRNVRQRLGPVSSVKHRLQFPQQQVGKRQVSLNGRKKYPWIRHVQDNALEYLEPNVNIRVREVKCEDTKRKKFAKTEPKKFAKVEVDDSSKNESDENTKLEKQEYAVFEPSEDSEEFKNLVEKAFLKHFKTMNENSAVLKIFLEQGGAGRLKCCVCGSSSKEFMEALGLAQHALFSCKSRSEHLGLHKAICVLMGWNSSNFLKGKWICQKMPSAEASSLREDLIIWPPVVLVHYRSTAIDNKDKYMTVSIEGLKHILRGMGCDLKTTTNICHGKSCMVVSFNGTYSGFREAEKLHKLFSNKQQGRPDFLKLLSSGHKTNHGKTLNSLVNDKRNHQENTQNLLVSDKTKHRRAQNLLVYEKTDAQDTQNILVGDKGKNEEAPTELVDEEMDAQDSHIVLVGDRTNHQEAQNALTDEQMDIQDNQTSRVGDVMDCQEAQNALVDEQMEITGTQIVFVGDEANHLEARNAVVDEQMDAQDSQTAHVGEKTDHQEAQNAQVDEIMDAQSVPLGDKANNQEAQNALEGEKDAESQTVLAGDTTDHEEAQSALVDEKMDAQEAQTVLAGDKTDHEEARTAFVDEKMDAREAQTVLAGDKTDHKDARTALIDEKMDAQEAQTVLAGDKTDHQEAQAALVDEKVDSQDSRTVEVGEKMNHQGAQNAPVDNTMEAQDTQTVLAGDKTNWQVAQNALGNEKMDAQATQTLPAGDQVNPQEPQNLQVDEKMEAQDTQTVSSGNKTNHLEAQNVFIDDKMDAQGTQTATVGGATDPQNAVVNGNSNHQEARNLVLCEKKDDGDSETVPLVDKTNHQEPQNALVDDKTGTWKIQPGLVDNQNHREARDVEIHGIANLEKIIVKDKPKRGKIENEIENWVYGYMGIASDLDALDPNTKRRCFVRSKREMEAAANAAIKTP